jgi:hypothetical protein
MKHSESKKIDRRKSVIVFGAKKPSFSLAQKRDFRSQLKQQSTFVPQKNGSIMICNICRSSSHSLTAKKQFFSLLSQIRKVKKKPDFAEKPVFFRFSDSHKNSNQPSIQKLPFIIRSLYNRDLVCKELEEKKHFFC